MYIVNEGQVLVYKTLRDPDGVKEIELSRIGPKGMFGEMAVIDEQNRSASVKAIESTKVTIITKQMFQDQLNNLPPWVINMIKLLVGRIRLTNEKLRESVDENRRRDAGDTEGLFVLSGKQREQEEQEVNKHEESRAAFFSTEQLLKDIH